MGRITRFETAPFLLVALLAGCGGGGGTSSRLGSAFLPNAPVSSPGPAAPGVAYLQNISSDLSTGTIAGGAQRSILAVMSGSVAAPGSAYALDQLLVASGASAAQNASSVQVVPARRSAAPIQYQPAKPPPPVEMRPAQAGALQLRLTRSQTRTVQRAYAAARFSTATVGEQQSIWVDQGSLSGSTGSAQLPATLALQTPHGNIWIDNTLLSQLDQSAIAQIGTDFENAYASDTMHFASADYPSNAPGLQPTYQACTASGAPDGTTPAYIVEPTDKRIDVMVVNAENLGSRGGYFSSVNYMPQTALNCLNASGASYHSNEAPFIFVGWFAGHGAAYELQEDLVRSTAHELQHLINFVNHSILPAAAASPSFSGAELTFINEGLSMLAQDLAVAQMYGNRGVDFDVADAMQRAQAYLSDPQAFSVSGFSGIDSPAWGGNGSTAAFNCAGGCYGGAYLFQRYLYDRFGGDAYTRAIETSGLTGEANLQAVCGESAGMLLDDFALALAAGSVGSASGPRFGFGALNLLGTYSDQFGDALQLQGVGVEPLSSAEQSVSAPVGGFAFVGVAGVPAAGLPVAVKDEATAPGFALSGGVAQH